MRVKVWGWLSVGMAAPFLTCANPNLGAYFNTYYNLRRLAKKIERAERKGDTLNLKPKYDSLEVKAAYLIKYYPHSKYLPDAIFYLGLAYSRKGQYEKAAKKFEEFLTYFPTHPLAERARIELARVYALDPRFRHRVSDALGDVRTPEALYWLAYARYMSGDYRGAAHYLSRMAGLGKKNPIYKKFLLLAVDVYTALKEPDTAERFLNEYLELELKPSERKLAEEKRGDILFLSGKYDEAEKVYSSIDHPPNSAEAGRLALKLARISLIKGDTSGALKHLERSANSAAEEKWEARLLMGRLKLLQGDYNGAALEFDRVYRGASGRWRSEAEKVKVILDEWRRLQTAKDVEKVYRKAEIYFFYLGDMKAADSIWRFIADSIRDERFSPKALYALVYLNLLKGDTAEAVNLKRRLRDEYPNSGFHRLVSDLLGI